MGPWLEDLPVRALHKNHVNLRFCGWFWKDCEWYSQSGARNRVDETFLECDRVDELS